MELITFSDAQGIELGDQFIVVMAVCIFSAWLPLFYHMCNFGEHVAIAFDDFNASIYDLPWHLCSLQLQKYTLFMLMIGQYPVYLQGFPGLNCSREMFKKVKPRANRCELFGYILM